nr:MAG TPA: hypothetical protein [Caudoviricetes sp.]
MSILGFLHLHPLSQRDVFPLSSPLEYGILDPSPGLPRTLCVGRSGQTNSSSPARRHPRTRRDRSAAGELENNLGECYL